MDTTQIKQLIKLFEDSKLSSMDLELEDMKIKLEKNTETVSYISNNVSVENTVIEEEEVSNVSSGYQIKSPLVGTFYNSSAHDAPAFVEEGKSVNKGDVICIIEAMKVMNEIRADRSGIVKEINVNNGEMIEFDQPLITLEA